MKPNLRAAIRGGLFLHEGQELNQHVVIFGETIEALTTEAEFDRLRKDDPAYADLPVMDATDLVLSPGLIDLHIHGSGGADVMSASLSDLETLSMTIAQRGTTAFLGTTLAADWADIYRALDTVRSAMEVGLPGAQVLGAHLEGPYLNPVKKGAHLERYLDTPKVAHIEAYTDVIRYMTLAPELPGAMDFIAHMTKNHPDIVLSMGHSGATYEEAVAAVDAGIRSTTHLFNAMTGLHHRDPGMVGAALDTDVNVEVIADGVHVHEGALRLAYKVKGPDQITLITDAMEAACLKCGQYVLGDQDVTVDETSVRLADGTLAGSILTLDAGVRKMMALGVPRDQALAMATSVPAKLLGIENKRGTMRTGSRADFVVFDKEMNVVQTLVAGRSVYRKTM